MLIQKNISGITILLIVFFIASCSESTISPTPDKESIAPLKTESSAVNSQGDRDLNLSNVKSMDEVNDMLAERGLNVRLAYAETVTLEDNLQKETKGKKGDKVTKATGQTIFADDRNLRLEAQWVPGDERRNAEGNKLTYLIDQTWMPANFGTPSEIDGNAAIDASFDTWNTIKKNSKLEIVKRADTGEQPSSFFIGGNPFLADISEIGFLPGIFFDFVLGPGASSNVLGVTFTSVFVDDEGNPTDINNDGYADVAFKEVWYNDAFQWTNDANGPGVDIETVALHENGHALGFGHFGKVFVTEGNNKIHTAPRAVMNAVILGTQRELLGTDKASFNSIYGNWPK